MDRRHLGHTSTARGEPAAGRAGGRGLDGPPAQRRMAEGIHASPRMVAQRRVALAAGQGGHAAHPRDVAQRKVEHDGTKYTGDGERCRWRALLKREVVKEYNLRTGKNLQGEANLTDEDLDRCHKVSFNDIEDVVVAYLNGVVDKNVLLALTQALAAPQQANEIGKWRNYMILSVESGYAPALICGQANKLLGILNSSLFNVILGDASTNRGIQEKLDLHFLETASGHYSLSPLSRSIGTAWVGHTSGVPFTPTGGHIRSSSSGPVPYGSLTPGSKDIIDKHNV